MTPQPRPRRAVLYLPASNPRAIAKARELPCDAVILDLEDAVAPEAKAAAREAACAAVGEGGWGGREVAVRVNGLDTPWGADDLRAAAAAGPDVVLAPKLDGPDDARRVLDALDAAPARTALWAMVETARSLFALEPLAALGRDTRLAGLVMGVNDLALETGWRLAPGRAPFAWALSATVAAARAHGLIALDGVWNGLDDEAGLLAECQQARDGGFDGKTLIHPRQIAPCLQAFAPTPAEAADARAVVAAFDAPEAAGLGALRVNGRMVERLHLAQAWAVLARAGPATA